MLSECLSIREHHARASCASIARQNATDGEERTDLRRRYSTPNLSHFSNAPENAGPK